VNKIN